MPFKSKQDRAEYHRNLYCFRDCGRCGKEKVWGNWCRDCYRAIAAIKKLIRSDRKARDIYFARPLWPLKDCEFIVRKIKQQLKQQKEISL